MIGLLNANALWMPLADESIDCCVSSPPYWGLRDYGTAEWVGGDAGCDHVFKNARNDAIDTGIRAGRTEPRKIQYKDTCGKCGAIRIDNQLGLEPTPEQFVANLVTVFREVWRVLKPWGIAFLNLGDSYSNGIGSNISDLIAERIKENVLFLSAGCTLTIAAQSDFILKDNKLSPDSELVSFFGVKRVFVKEGNNNLRQIFDGFESITNCRISSSVVTTVNISNSEIILNSLDSILIIVSDHDLNTNSALEVPVFSLTTKDRETPLAIKETRKPITEGVGYIEPVGDTVSFNTFRKRFPNINFINNSISFADTFLFTSKLPSNLEVTKSSREHLSFSLMDGFVKFAVFSVGHLFASNEYGSIVRYTELYHQAEQTANERKAKQELGIPDMVKRALMRDGWICRSTIIWAKPNPMPESVTDRPTKAHEYLFLLTKRARYYYDADAVRETSEHLNLVGKLQRVDYRPNGTMPNSETGQNKQVQRTSGRNRRTVWTIPTRPYKGAHFATFPPALVEPCIKAGTSERGNCPECGKPWERVVENHRRTKTDKYCPKHLQGSTSGLKHPGWRKREVPNSYSTTLGWQPTCDHAAEPVPAIVLDPFAGSGTTLMVARELGRSSVGLDLSFDYLKNQARKRLSLDKLALHGKAKQVDAAWQDTPMFQGVERGREAGE